MLENEIKTLKLSDQQAKALLADSKELLIYLTPKLQDQTLLVYLDPFGLEGCEFETLMPLLTRSTDSSTEIIININMPEFHRRAGREAIQMGKEIPAEIGVHHSFLNKIFGGDYWKTFEFDSTMDNKPKLRELKVMEEYCKKLEQCFPFTRFCPVRESKTGPTKYFIVFCSRHPDALWLMNDIMRNAYQKYIFGSPYGELDLFNPLILRTEIAEIVKVKPGISRKEVTIKIFDRHFLQYSKSDIGKTVGELNGKVLRFESPTGRLNDGALLFPI